MGPWRHKDTLPIRPTLPTFRGVVTTAMTTDAAVTRTGRTLPAAQSFWKPWRASTACAEGVRRKSMNWRAPSLFGLPAMPATG